MVWVTILLFLLIYIASIFAVSFFGDIPKREGALGFTTFGQAMFSLFTIVILADWTDLVMQVLEYNVLHAFLFFIPLIMIGTFGLLNLIIGVITERTEDVRARFEE